MEKKKAYLLWLSVLVLCVLLPQCAFAENATAYTYSMSTNGFIRTQDAYLPGPVLFRDLALSAPEDLYIRDGNMYICDTGNSRIVRVCLDTGETQILAQDVLNQPTGLYVDEKGCIYVADYGARKVLLLDAEGSVIREYMRPEETIFGSEATYFPRKVAANAAGDVYIVSEGGYDGIINLNDDGEFMGYFGFNYTQMSLWQRIRQLIFTETQLKKVLNEKPAPFGNLDIDEDGIIYTVTSAVNGNAVKRHDISGANMIAEKMVDESNFVDVCVGSYGQIYALTQTGLINEYDASGSLLVTFGGKAIASDRAGFFSVAAAIACDDTDCLYVLDRERALVHVFYPTDFILGIHRAISDYENGLYESSRAVWQDVIAKGGKTNYAYYYLSKTYFQTENYDEALYYGRLAESKSMYSDAFWEKRNEWLMDYLGYVLGAVVLGMVLHAIYRHFHPKPAQVTLSRQELVRDPGLRGDLKLMLRFIRHPIDTLYYIRTGECGTLLSASVMYLLGFVVCCADYYFRGFVFAVPEGRQNSILITMALYFGAVFFVVIGNYMVASITEGEGKLQHVYIMGAYALTPVLLILPVVTVMSYVLTLNEVFFIQTGVSIAWGWTAILTVIGFHEVHQFSIRQTVANVLWTLFFIIMALIVLSVLYMFWDQLADFVYALFKEVSYSVQ